MPKKPRPNPVQPVTEAWIDYSELHIDLGDLAVKLGRKPEQIEQAAARLRISNNPGFNRGATILEQHEVDDHYLDWVVTAAMSHYDLSATHLESVLAYYELIWRQDRASYMLKDPFTYEHIKEALAGNDKRALDRAFRRKLTD